MYQVIWNVVFGVICLSGQPEAKKIDLDTSLVPIKEQFLQSSTSDLIKGQAKRFERWGQGQKPVGSKTYALGTENLVSHDGDYRGFMSVVFAAYANHLTLVTSPDDWWITIAQRVAAAVDKHSKKESVRNHFVGHEGKKELVVHVSYVSDLGEAEFFSAMSQQVEKNINDPGYVSNMQPDFSTTTPLHGIVGNIVIMSSLQEYFIFTGSIECGIPRIEMKGKLADWEKLSTKFSDLKKRLAPVSSDIGLDGWWNGVEKVLAQLVNTYKGNPDKNWWHQIIQKREVNVGCGTKTEWDGWFLKDFLNLSIEEVPSGLLSVPLTINDNGDKTEAALVAGIAGFKLDQAQNSVEAEHAWNLMLEPDSYLRKSIK